MSTMKQNYKVGILTVSDSCFHGVRDDLSGKQMYDLLSRDDMFPAFKDIMVKIAPDVKHRIERILTAWADDYHLDLVLTIGGTGFSPRDVTPEATRAVCDRQAPGLAQSVITLCSKDTPFALLSRATCGIRKETIIYNLPGSVKGSKECFMKVANILPHALDQLKCNIEAVEQFHMDIQGPNDVTRRKSNVSVPKAASRDRISPYPLISSAEALKIVLENCITSDVEIINYKESIGFVCSDDVISITASPPFRTSMKDGYAVFASDGEGTRKLLGVMTAGDNPSSWFLERGGCVRVSTGAPLPVNADCVVQVEDTVVTKTDSEGDKELEIKICKVPEPGVDIRQAGCDIGIKQTIIKKGKTITPWDCGIMAAGGINSIAVHSPPRVAVLSTGDELVNPGEDLKCGCIFDSNKTLLCSSLKEMKVNYYDAGIAKDCPDDLRDKLEHAFLNADVVIVTGGVSMGEKDLVKEVLKVDFSADIHFGRIFMKPGKPTAFSTLTFQQRKKMVFCLPGNPVSAAVTFHLYVVPCLRKIMGHKDVTQVVIKAKLGQDVILDPRPEYHRVSLRWEKEEDKPITYSTGSQRSSRLLSMTDANALMMLPPGTEERPRLKAGVDVQVMLLNYFAPYL